jgi:hypothetical protein
MRAAKIILGIVTAIGLTGVSSIVVDAATEPAGCCSGDAITAKCSGKDPCKACKNCSSCDYCKNGKTCGACKSKKK